MYAMVHDGQILGFCYDVGSNPDPEYYTLYEAPEVGLNNIYFDRVTNAVLVKPDQPGDNYRWDNETHQWIEIPPPPPPPEPTIHDTPISQFRKHPTYLAAIHKVSTDTSPLVASILDALVCYLSDSAELPQIFATIESLVTPLPPAGT